MKKDKFILTSDLINIAPEEYLVHKKNSTNKRGLDTNKTAEFVEKEQLNIRISKELKIKLQIWCITNDKPMVEVIEQLIREKVS